MEFEDQSALRLAENSEIKFRQLSMNDAGVKVNEIEVVRGVVFFDVRSKSDDVYRATADGYNFPRPPQHSGAHQCRAGPIAARGFEGRRATGEPAATGSVKKNETLTLDPNQPSDYKVTHGTEALPVDAWNRSASLQQAYAGSQGYGGPTHRLRAARP